MGENLNYLIFGLILNVGHLTLANSRPCVLGLITLHLVQKFLTLDLPHLA